MKFIDRLSRQFDIFLTLIQTARPTKMSNDGEICGVAEWYTDRNILVTGATGFMGKVLVEKLLRSCPNLGRIYILVRPKKNQQPEERLQSEILNTKLFDLLRESNPSALTKVTAIQGDITADQLDLSIEDTNILVENVSVVFHSAATVKFDEALKVAVNINIVGTERLLNLCYQMKKLTAFIHVSTAYCHPNQKEVHEKIYAPPTDLNHILQCVNCVEDDTLEEITPMLIRDRPNTYTFTKALAEHTLEKHSSKLPIAIVRPSAVTASWTEPFPGWIDNLNGPTGIFVGIGKGILQSILCYKNMIVDFIPVDVAIGLMICVARKIGIERSNSIQIFNCTSGQTNHMTWDEIEDMLYHCSLKYPFNDVLWYPRANFKSNRIHQMLHSWLFQTVPAYIIDAYCRMKGKQPIMVRVQNKFSKIMNTVEYFTTKEWKFHSENMYTLWNSLSDRDRTVFNYDIRKLDKKEYFFNYYLGIKRYVLKEKDSTLPSAKWHMKKMKYLHFGLQFLFLLILYWLLFHNSVAEEWLLYFVFELIVLVKSELCNS